MYIMMIAIHAYAHLAILSEHGHVCVSPLSCSNGKDFTGLGKAVQLLMHIMAQYMRHVPLDIFAPLCCGTHGECIITPLHSPIVAKMCAVALIIMMGLWMGFDANSGGSSAVTVNLY
jgi:hypothetical protein